jgi:hypothetical protein
MSERTNQGHLFCEQDALDENLQPGWLTLPGQEPAPCAYGESEYCAVTVLGVTNQDHAITAGCFYAVPTVAV